MKLQEIEFSNCGPVLKGTIKLKKINVFFGPNNSGKSLISRLIHGINFQPDFSALMQRRKDLYNKDERLTMTKDEILRNAGINYKDIVTHGKKTARINIKFKKPLILNFGNTEYKTNMDLRSYIIGKNASKVRKSRDSVYIPAGRTGTIQFFANIVQTRNRFLVELLHFFGEQGSVNSKDTSPKDIKRLTKSFTKLPEHLEQFYDLILSVHEDGLSSDIEDFFSDLFPGSIKLSNGHGFPTIAYEDPTGFVTEIESAGSGTVSSFPIIVGVYYVKKNGRLIIEEPEVHLEPTRQLKLIDTLQHIARKREIDLVFTTHSDYVIKQLLALVSSKKIKHTDLGLYYFQRNGSKFTTIREIAVDKTGDAEQPIFEEAMNMLVKEFSK